MKEGKRRRKRRNHCCQNGQKALTQIIFRLLLTLAAVCLQTLRQRTLWPVVIGQSIWTLRSTLSCLLFLCSFWMKVDLLVYYYLFARQTRPTHVFYGQIMRQVSSFLSFVSSFLCPSSSGLIIYGQFMPEFCVHSLFFRWLKFWKRRMRMLSRTSGHTHKDQAYRESLSHYSCSLLPVFVSNLCIHFWLETSCLTRTMCAARNSRPFRS